MRCASSAIWPAISTPVGPAPTTTKVSRRVDVLPARRAELGELEGAEDPAAQLEGVVDALHARARTRRTGRCRSRTGPAPAATISESYGVTVSRPSTCEVTVRALEVDVGDLAEEHPGVALAGEDLARRRGDLALAEDAGRHLVEQRLEEVVAGLRDHRDVDVGALERLGAEQPPEARTRSPRPGADRSACDLIHVSTMLLRSTSCHNRGSRLVAHMS